jgi:hypothetical protein
MLDQEMTDMEFQKGIMGRHNFLRWSFITWVAIVILLNAYAPTISHAGEISEVTVRNAEFEIINVLKDPESLRQFEALWKKKKKLDTSINTKWLYKIDIMGKDHENRWLYSPEGYVKVLSKAKVPTYAISSLNEFNKLIMGENINSLK